MARVTEVFHWGVFYADLGYGVGSEQIGDRPVLVVSREPFNRALETVTVVPLTSMKQGSRVRPGEVVLARGIAGLSYDSKALVHQIRTINKTRLRRPLGQVTDNTLRRQVLDTIASYFDIGSV